MSGRGLAHTEPVIGLATGLTGEQPLYTRAATPDAHTDVFRSDRVYWAAYIV